MESPAPLSVLLTHATQVWSAVSWTVDQSVECVHQAPGEMGDTALILMTALPAHVTQVSSARTSLLRPGDTPAPSVLVTWCEMVSTVSPQLWSSVLSLSHVMLWLSVTSFQEMITSGAPVLLVSQEMVFIALHYTMQPLNLHVPGSVSE